MKEFEVTITETLKRTITLEAESKEEAQQMVSDRWHNSDIVLTSDDFTDVDFISNEGVEIGKAKTMDVLLVEPGEHPKMVTIETGLESLQKAVGGYIEAIYPFSDPVVIISDEESKLSGKTLNRALRDESGDVYDIIAGSFLVCGVGESSFESLPKELQKKYADLFRQPEAFLKMGRGIISIPIEPKKAAHKAEKNSHGMER